MTLDIRNSVWAAMGSLMCPLTKGMRVMEANFLYPPVAERFPDLADLMGAGSDLNWHELAFVEPWWSSAFIHVGEDFMAVGVEEFGDCGDVKV